MHEVRREMLERGFALLSAPALLSSGPLLPSSSAVLAPGCKRWWKYPQLVRHGSWLEQLLNWALPEEALGLVSLDFRCEAAGTEDREVDRLHADGSYIRSVTTLFGPSTIYRSGKAEYSVPDGQTLLMTAINRARLVRVPCTLHRRPGPGAARAVIVCSFEPSGTQLPMVTRSLSGERAEFLLPRFANRSSLPRCR